MSYIPYILIECEETSKPTENVIRKLNKCYENSNQTWRNSIISQWDYSNAGIETIILTFSTCVELHLSVVRSSAGCMDQDMKFSSTDRSKHIHVET